MVKSFLHRQTKNEKIITRMSMRKKMVKPKSNTNNVLLKYVPDKGKWKSGILNDMQISNLIGWFPGYMRTSDWTRLYKMDEDGCSLITFYNQCKDTETSVLVVKD